MGIFYQGNCNWITNLPLIYQIKVTTSFLHYPLYVRTERMNRYTLIIIFLISIVPFPCLGVEFDKLIERDGLYYKSSSDDPFTGTVIGEQQGYMHNGKREGYWRFFYGDNVLKATGNYKHGMQNGKFTIYHDNSQILYQGNYLEGKKEGLFNFYYKDGRINKQKSGIYRDGLKIED